MNVEPVSNPLAIIFWVNHLSIFHRNVTCGTKEIALLYPSNLFIVILVLEPYIDSLRLIRREWSDLPNG